MASLNKVFLIGNLTRDPELRQLPSGTAVCNFRLAVNRRYKTGQGEDREETCFLDIESWGRQAETCSRYLSKGRAVLVEGRLQQDEWTDANTGETRRRLLVRALQVQFLGAGSTGRTQDPGKNRYKPSSQNRPLDRASHQSQKADDEMPDFEPVDEESYGNIPF